MDLHIKKVWLPGAASCLLFFGFYWVLIWLPFDKTRFQFLAIPYLVLPFVGALAADWSRAICGENCVWIVLRGQTLHSAAFPRRPFRDPRIHCCRWPIAGTWRMAVLPPAPQRTVALTSGLHQRNATDKCRDACPLHLRSWGSRRGRSVQLVPGAGGLKHR